VNGKIPHLTSTIHPFAWQAPYISSGEILTHYVGVVRMLARVPHPEAGKAAIRFALVDFYAARRPQGRALVASNVQWRMYPVLLSAISSKLISFHPKGFMKGDMLFMPYVKSGFMKDD
jgi:hypothetical protein